MTFLASVRCVMRALVVVAVLCCANPADAQTITSDQTGINHGYFYTFWSNGIGSASMRLGPGGKYCTSWHHAGDFTAGKGWAVGGRRKVTFSGQFNGGTHGYLAIYGWTTHPLVEYYIVEDHGDWTPPGGKPLGTFTSDGGTYKIYETTRVSKPSIRGTATFHQYWSVRSKQRSSGTVTTGNHFDAWARLGLKLGTFDYMVVLTEGFHQGSGSSCITVNTPAGVAHRGMHPRRGNR